MLRSWCIDARRRRWRRDSVSAGHLAARVWWSIHYRHRWIPTGSHPEVKRPQLLQPMVLGSPLTRCLHSDYLPSICYFYFFPYIYIYTYIKPFFCSIWTEKLLLKSEKTFKKSLCAAWCAELCGHPCRADVLLWEKLAASMLRCLHFFFISLFMSVRNVCRHVAVFSSALLLGTPSRFRTDFGASTLDSKYLH